jgi:hypothetical protein
MILGRRRTRSGLHFPGIYYKGTNQLVRQKKPSPRSFGIIGLGEKSRQIFEFKGLIRKIFRNKELGCQRALKMGLGQLRGPSWETGAPLTAPIRFPLSRTAGWKSVTRDPGVCDEKRVEVRLQRERFPRLLSPSALTFGVWARSRRSTCDGSAASLWAMVPGRRPLGMLAPLLVTCWATIRKARNF